MGIRKGEIVEVRVDNIAFGGQGIARVDGFVLFVRGAIPGDLVKALVVKKKKDYAEAKMTDLLEPSPDRIRPPCPYHGFCGGCQWQHVRYERQLAYKQNHVKEAVSRIGGLSGIPVHEVIPSKKQFAYRNKMEFSFSDRRWLLPEEMETGEKEKGFALGLHVPGTYYKVIDVEACLLQQEKGNEILRCVKKYARDSGIPVYGLKSHQGFWRFLTLRYSNHFDQWMVNLVTSEERPDVLKPLADALSTGFLP